METKTYILKLQTDSERNNAEVLEEYLKSNYQNKAEIVAYSFKEIEVPKLDEN